MTFGLKVPFNIISFTDKTEGIYHNRGEEEEEINSLVTTGSLFDNDRNSLFIRNSANTPTKDQENEFDDLTTILMMKQVKMKTFLHRPTRVYK